MALHKSGVLANTHNPVLRKQWPLYIQGHLVCIVGFCLRSKQIERKKKKRFRISMGYIVSSWSAWATWDFVNKEVKKKKKSNEVEI